MVSGQNSEGLLEIVLEDVIPQLSAEQLKKVIKGLYLDENEETRNAYFNAPNQPLRDGLLRYISEHPDGIFDNDLEPDTRRCFIVLENYGILMTRQQKPRKHTYTNNKGKKVTSYSYIFITWHLRKNLGGITKKVAEEPILTEAQKIYGDPEIWHRAFRR